MSKKKLIKSGYIALFLVLIGVLVFVCIGLYNNRSYSEKELKKLKKEIKEELSENYVWKEGIIGVEIDYEEKVIVIEINSLSKNKEQIIEELSKKYRKAIRVNIVECHETVT